MIRLTGAYPDRQVSRDRDRTEYNFNASTVAIPYTAEPDFVQPIRGIRTQPKYLNCVGESCAAMIDSKLPDALWSSGVSIWREARRRQGLIEVLELGTRYEYAVDGLVARGWDPYREGEETDDEEAGKGAAPAGDDLADEMFADDKRLGKELKRYRILGFGVAVFDAVDEALRRGWGVGIGTGLLTPFFHYARTPDQPEHVLGTEYMGGHMDNHAQRVAGRAAYMGRRKYLVQNSWGTEFGGCHAPDGTWLAGCVWVDEDVIVAAHDIHVLQVTA
jgi:hypothetical protein